MSTPPPSTAQDPTGLLLLAAAATLPPPPPSSNPPPAALPQPSHLLAAASAIHTSLPTRGLTAPVALTHILHDLVPGFNGSKTSPNYYGFVTGGVLPVAEVADRVVAAWDQNVQVHLPHQGIATTVEWRAGAMLCELLGLSDGVADGNDMEGKGTVWAGRTFTTGATASNVLGLACGREAVLAGNMAVLRRRSRVLAEKDSEAGVKGQGIQALGLQDYSDQLAGEESDSVGELGLLEACRRAGVHGFQVLTTMGHSSIAKAASIVGLGRGSVVDIGMERMPWRFDMQKLEGQLEREGVASIVVVGCGEVNTGRYATRGEDEMRRVRALCDRFGAWLHVDGAFGLFARALPPGDEFAVLREACEGIELADSITGDAHKCLNVPYDSGIFLTRSISLLTRTFRNPNAAYLSSSLLPLASPSEYIPSPLNIGIENSRRFRALPIYAVLIAHGQHGLSEILAQQVRLARRIAAFVDACEGYELLPMRAECPATVAESDILSKRNSAAERNTVAAAPFADTGIIVLFRAVDEHINTHLAARINRSGRIMVSGTAWEARPAVRIAVSTWMVEVERDLQVVKEVLEEELVL